MSEIDQPKPEAENTAPKPFRFGIPHLLYLTALIASGMVVAGPWSFLISGAVLAIWVVRARSSINFAELLIVLAILAILIAMLMPAVQSVRSSPRWIHCQNNMRQCLLALHNYQSANEVFPSAFETDSDGKPIHSWRVMILPFIEQNALYDAYDFKEPWDGPNNSKLANQMPIVYRCPSVPYSDNETTYKLVSDPEAFFDGSKKRGFEDAVDGSSCTIVLVEDSQNPVNWMKPEDISIEDAATQLLNKQGCHCRREDSLFYTTFYGANVGVLDGSTQRIAPNASPDSLRKALRFADGHSPDVSQFTGSLVVHKPQGYLALAVYLFLLALPGWVLEKKRQ